MKYVALALLLAAGLAFGQSRPETLKASGTVVALDHELGRVTVDTNPVYDRRLLDKLRAGRKIEFEFIRQGRSFVLVRVLKNEP